MRYSAQRMTACVTIAAVLLSPLASTHMFIASPKPIEGAAPKGPLHSDGSNFPCHGANLTATGSQRMETGSCFKLQLDLGANGENTAVHGGGSCQLAVTYETSLDAIRDPNNWHVIYSIEGGCPSNSAGNLLTSTYCTSLGQDECVHTWDVSIPEGLQSGHAVMSWTWFNTVGDREMYQNCARVEITGGTGEEMGSFPAMYVANIGPGDVCTAAPERTNLAFPEPGKYRTTMSATKGENWPYMTATCSVAGSKQQPSRVLHSHNNATSVVSRSTATTKSPFGSDGLPGSEALAQLASAAIVTSPTLLGADEPISPPRDTAVTAADATRTDGHATGMVSQQSGTATGSRDGAAYHDGPHVDVSVTSRLSTSHTASKPPKPKSCQMRGSRRSE